MKKILIIGKNSYIGEHIEAWLNKDTCQYQVKQVEASDNSWREESFSDIDVVIHVAGIVHRPDISDWEIYKKVNVDLPLEVAKRAKECGVSQFIFLSTMAVFGIGKKLWENIIDENTCQNPISNYGKSKYEAEKKLTELENDYFKVSIIRPPNVYGKNCKGNYISLYKSVISKLPIVPYAYQNVKQSVIFIDNLCELVKLIIDNQDGGLFMPQDDKAVSAVELIQSIADGIEKKVYFSKFFGIIIKLFRFIPILKKAYGGVCYSDEVSNCYNNSYIVVSFEEAMRRTVSNG